MPTPTIDTNLPVYIPERPPGVVLFEKDALVSQDISSRFRLLNFLGDVTVVRDGDKADITILGGGPFCHDYLVDSHHTGSEGQIVTMPNTTHTYKIYTTVKGAVDDANANRQTNSQSTSFLICGTGLFEDRYQEAVQIDLDPPSAGSYHLFGTGADTTQIDGMMTSGSLFNIPTQSLDSQVEFHHIEMRTLESIALVQGGGSTRINIDNCWLRPNDSGARAIEAGLGVVGWNISNTNFEGTGIGIDSGTLMNVRLTNCYMAMTIGIRMVNAVQVYCTNVKFNCSLRDVEIGATTGAMIFSAGGACEFNKGIHFTSGGAFSWFDNFTIDGCTFIIGSGDIGIDYSGATREGALLLAVAHVLTGNTFRGTGTAKGIVGGSSLADGPHHSTVVSNAFTGFTAGNEIIDMDLTGDNEVAHNRTDSGATLPNTGVGHVIGGAAEDEIQQGALGSRPATPTGGLMIWVDTDAGDAYMWDTL